MGISQHVKNVRNRGGSDLRIFQHVRNAHSRGGPIWAFLNMSKMPTTGGVQSENAHIRGVRYGHFSTCLTVPWFNITDQDTLQYDSLSYDNHTVISWNLDLSYSHIYGLILRLDSYTSSITISSLIHYHASIRSDILIHFLSNMISFLVSFLSI
jgi:hypothetical protein